MDQLARYSRFDEIDWDSWQAVDPATIVLLPRGDRVLLIRKKRGLGAGKINGPGGKLDPGETPIECAVREVEEELGITPVDLKAVGENRFQFADGYAIHVHVFLASDFEGEPQETAEAVPLWFPRDAIPYEEMWEDDRLWVPAALAGRRVDGWFLFDDDRMVGYRLEVEGEGVLEG